MPPNKSSDAPDIHIYICTIHYTVCPSILELRFQKGVQTNYPLQISGRSDNRQSGSLVGCILHSMPDIERSDLRYIPSFIVQLLKVCCTQEFAIGRHQCEQCSKSFKTKSLLMKHAKFHSGLKFFLITVDTTDTFITFIGFLYIYKIRLCL